MKQLAPVFFFFTIVTGFGQNATLDQQNGLGSYKFGTTPENYKNLTLEIDEDNVKLYSETNTSTKIESFGFELVNVSFLKNKLSSVSLHAVSSPEKLFQVLKQKYGSPTKSNKAKGTFEWTGSTVELYYEKSPSGSKAVITFSSKEIYRTARKT